MKKKDWNSTNREFLNFSFKPHTMFWMQCKLSNPTKQHIEKILELDWPHLGIAILFDKNTTIYQGTFYMQKQRLLTPRFNITLHPKETKLVTIAAASPVSLLFIKPILWDKHPFIEHEINRFIAYALFFGALFALLIYNFFIYFYTKDNSYLWYCAYLIGILIHQAYYTGYLEYFILKESIKSRLVIHLIIALSLIFIPPFTRSFLQTKQYMPFADKILKFLPPYILFVSVLADPKTMLILLIPLSLVLLTIILHALKKGIIQAKYFAIGWACVVTSMAIMGLYNLGYLSFISRFPYIIQIGIVAEAIIFSIGLAERINRLKAEKEAANAKLIIFQKEEQKRLEKLVKARTKELILALEEKEMLFKELHHRVKNNLQMIISILRLQSNRINDPKSKSILQTAKDRINSISKLHEILYKTESIQKIDTQHYFKTLVEELLQINNLQNRIKAHYNIKTTIDINKAIYCGLIVNELVSNSIKHAFKESTGNLYIKLHKNGNSICFIYEDDGQGFDNNHIQQHGFGLLLVKSLATLQLKGSITFHTGSKPKIEIVFPE